MKLEENVLHIFTDGSCYPNPGAGGYGVVLVFNGVEKEHLGGAKKATNNQMELEAIWQALQLIKSHKYPIKIYSDSQYAVNAITVWHHAWRNNNWHTASGSPVKNVPLVDKISQHITKLQNSGVRITVQWVKGHAGHKYNEMADYLAGAGRKQHA